MNADWVNVVVSMLNVAVTFYVAFAVQRAGRHVVRMEQDRAIKDAWVQVDQVALADPRNLQALDAMFHPDRAHEDEDAKRRRWLAYMALNPLEAAWTSARRQHMYAGAISSSEHSMRALVRDRLVYELIGQVVYSEEFKARCRIFREEWLASPEGRLAEASAQQAAAVDLQDRAGGVAGAP